MEDATKVLIIYVADNDQGPIDLMNEGFDAMLKESTILKAALVVIAERLVKNHVPQLASVLSDLQSQFLMFPIVMHESRLIGDFLRAYQVAEADFAYNRD